MSVGTLLILFLVSVSGDNYDEYEGRLHVVNNNATEDTGRFAYRSFQERDRARSCCELIEALEHASFASARLCLHGRGC